MSPQRVLLLVISVAVIVVCLMFVVKEVRRITNPSGGDSGYSDVQPPPGSRAPMFVPPEMRDQVPPEMEEAAGGGGAQ